MAAPVRRWMGLRQWYLPEEMKRIYLRCSLSVLIICMALVDQSQTQSHNCLDGEAVNVLDVDIACTKHEEKCTAEKECTNDGGTFVQSEIIGSETMLQKLQNETYLWIWLEEKRYWVNKTKIDNLRQMFPEPILSTFWSTYIENKALFVCRTNGTLNGTAGVKVPTSSKLTTAVPTTFLEDRRPDEHGNPDKCGSTGAGAGAGELIIGQVLLLLNNLWNMVAFTFENAAKVEIRTSHGHTTAVPTAVHSKKGTTISDVNDPNNGVNNNEPGRSATSDPDDVTTPSASYDIPVNWVAVIAGLVLAFLVIKLADSIVSMRSTV